jgi:hypothetical protein
MTDLPERVRESKRAMRKHLALLPFGEKLALLEKMRERRLAISSSPLSRQWAAARGSRKPAPIK